MTDNERPRRSLRKRLLGSRSAQWIAAAAAVLTAIITVYAINFNAAGVTPPAPQTPQSKSDVLTITQDCVASAIDPSDPDGVFRLQFVLNVVLSDEQIFVFRDGVRGDRTKNAERAFGTQYGIDGDATDRSFRVELAGQFETLRQAHGKQAPFGCGS